jgi:hypothetical protein
VTSCPRRTGIGFNTAKHVQHEAAVLTISLTMMALGLPDLPKSLFYHLHTVAHEFSNGMITYAGLRPLKGHKVVLPCARLLRYGSDFCVSWPTTNNLQPGHPQEGALMCGLWQRRLLRFFPATSLHISMRSDARICRTSQPGCTPWEGLSLF